MCSVQPVASLVDLLNEGTMRCLINNERSGPFMNHSSDFEDHFLGGDINESVWKIVDELGWRDDLQRLIDAGPITLA